MLLKTVFFIIHINGLLMFLQQTKKGDRATEKSHDLPRKVDHLVQFHPNGVFSVFLAEFEPHFIAISLSSPPFIISK